MQPDNILKADMLDIIFDNRNKAYGAYNLRKYYNERIYKALAISILMLTLIFSVSFFPGEKLITTSGYIDDPAYRQIPETRQTKPFEPVLQHPPKQFPLKLKVISPLAFQKPVITMDTLNVARITNITDAVSGLSMQPTGQTGHSPDTDQNPSFALAGHDNIAKPVDKSIPVDHPDIMPSYPGGVNALQKFLQKNLVRPTGLSDGETVSVKIKFIVGYDGILKGFETIEDGGPAFNKEVIRVLKKMPAWIPGKAAGENVSVIYALPVLFSPVE